MPTITWPSSLPAAQREGYGYTPRSAALTSNFGLVARSREIYSDMPTDFTVSWSFTDAQWWYFEGFYKHALRSGTQFFLLPVVVGGVLEEREVTFNGATWQALLAGVSHGRLTATLVTRKGTAMDATTWELFEMVDSPEDLAELLQALSDFANNGDY